MESYGLKLRVGLEHMLKHVSTYLSAIAIRTRHWYLFSNKQTHPCPEQESERMVQGSQYPNGQPSTDLNGTHQDRYRADYVSRLVTKIDKALEEIRENKP